MLLENDGKGKFRDVTTAKASFFSSLGMITDAIWMNIDKSGSDELIVTGEWMSPRVFQYKEGKMQDISARFFTKSYAGWWNCIKASDLDQDGDLDLIAGNWGTNSPFKAGTGNPVKLYYGDFDSNGFVDPLIFHDIMGKSYPMASRDELTDQMVSLRQRFPTYDSYADATLTDILDSTQLQMALLLKAEVLETVWFENTPNGFVLHALPVEANFSPVHVIHVDDFNADGSPDILLFGNNEQARIKVGKMDASYGVLLTGDSKGNFQYVDQVKSGLQVTGAVRDLLVLPGSGGKKILMVGRNNDDPVFYQY
jgi:hypothetical protein